ncbi:PDZ domain-containing protein [Frankia sp. CNm7]|uniref:endopeptidase La n=1 Tax=Frankia nepalensis TaxID=1836974 RepID=A0A937RJ16_9ACTN|nr:PDZ domain-containing protein [Frankia nepalensis]MBL7500757.1 PDZ domain-containing protein [Frankia nepalensis]MBL7511755.1 PDZ domain-containing protein [Frankia nepalensis]MBL7524334.1 PDZ domain-containing protein [Frankia nepalensis]MBL7633171.1 PDZ domain-containing protein [Frankia nepalensis]
MARRTQTLVVASVLALALGIWGLWLPVPFVTLAPGPVTNTLGSVKGVTLIEIEGRQTYPTSGQLQLTTVEETPRLTLLDALEDWFGDDSAVVPRELIQPPGKTQEQIQQQNTAAMVESQDSATAAALAELGIEPIGTSVVVDEVLAASPATGKLSSGDVVTEINGTAVHSEMALREEIGKAKPGDDVKVTYQRGSDPATTVVITTKAAEDNAQRPIIGIRTAEKQTYPFTVQIRISDVGGPSAGLMFALGIVDLLTPGQLTGGRTIAGTGTIDNAGKVGPIGGIQQKILGARGSGATVFLVPAANCADAKRMASDELTLVKVDNLHGALDALDKLGGPGQSTIPTC